MNERSSRFAFPYFWIFFVSLFSANAFAQQPIQLHWLDGKPPVSHEAVSWGVPWPKGALKKTDSLQLKNGAGATIPLQSWPLAYWPDGSVKWSGQAISTLGDLTGTFQLSVGPAVAPATALTAKQDDASIEINTGTLVARILKNGSNLFESLTIGQRQVAINGKLILQTEDRSQLESEGIIRQENFVSKIDKVTLEQSGPVRAVVKIEGMHTSMKGQRAWLPFVVRLYFSAGTEAIRVVHSFVYDGDPHKDMIKGIGLSFSVPFKEELHNRHVRFTGDDQGVWDQPIRLLPGYRNFPANQYAQHLAGERMANYGENLPANIASVPVWNDFKLTQLGPDSFSIDKRTSDKSSWLHVNNGKRSSGLAVLADVSGGIAVGVKDFWQKYPASIEINNAATDMGEMKVWLWSPDGDAMDLRHYDNTGHALDTNYEDWKPGWDSAYGVAHTADLTLFAFASIPSNENLVGLARSSQQPPLLVCTPQYYHDQQAFGYWSLPDSSSPATKWIEQQLSYLFDFYHAQVEERHWYSFWDFGDIMHNYDFGRHEWRYDVGGWAWTNSELAPDMFLYYTFLRTGRPEAFRMAEAMTRHTSEVDVHHIGVFAPLGSRHNVNHWGDGAKQPRISQVAFKRFYYYLTTDDRVGDLMHEQLDADLAYARVQAMDPGHIAVGITSDEKTQPWTRADVPGANRGGGRGARPLEGDARFNNARFGLDWICYAINWTTEWERGGDPAWREHVLAGMNKIVTDSGAGNSFGGGYFDIIFGGAEDLYQMEAMYPDAPDFWKGWALTSARLAASNGNNMTGPRMAAYAAHVLKDPALGYRAWEALIGDGMADRKAETAFPQPSLILPPLVLNPVHDPIFLGRSAGWQLHGPASVQWALNAIETLELAKEYLPLWESGHPPVAPQP